MTSPAAAVATACHGVREAMPLDLMPSGRNPIIFGTAADSPRLPHACFLQPLIFQQQNAHGYYAARLCPTKQTPGRVHTAGGRATGHRMCRHVSPRFRLPPYLLSPQPSEVECVRQIKTKINTCLLYTSPSPRDKRQSRMPSSA